MTNHYVRCWVNRVTGDIEHVLVSSAPILNDDIDPGSGYAVEEMIIETTDDVPQIKARDMLGKLERRGSRVEIKQGLSGLSVASRKQTRLT